MRKAWEIKTFDYVVNFWFGPRSTKKRYKYDPKSKTAKQLALVYGQWYQQVHHYYLVNAHCKFIKNNNIDNLNKVYFVINEWEEQDNSKVYYEVLEVVKWYGLEGKIKVIFHDNTNHSYGAWNKGIKQLIEDGSKSDYAFLCEDDYLPVDEEFYKPFFFKFDKDKSNNVGYIAQHIDDVKYHRNVYKKGVGSINTHHTQKHAAVSNGFLNLNIAKTILKKYKNVFEFNLSDFENANLSTRAKEQIIFTNYITDEGYKLKSISDICYVPFDIQNNNKIKDFGNISDYCPIKPYEYGPPKTVLSNGQELVNNDKEIKFRDMTESDLKWFLEVRNDDSTRNFLLDNSIFSLNEAQEWFKNLDKTLFPYQIISRIERKYIQNEGNYLRQKSNFFEIELPIGYTRRYMTEINGEEIIELGCDIHPKHRRKGYAKKAYIHMLSQLETASLWVFEDNFARNLYFELGFRDNGVTKINRGRKEYQMVWKRKI
jgi:hypothetical protein